MTASTVNACDAPSHQKAPLYAIRTKLFGRRGVPKTGGWTLATEYCILVQVGCVRSYQAIQVVDDSRPPWAGDAARHKLVIFIQLKSEEPRKPSLGLDSFGAYKCPLLTINLGLWLDSAEIERSPACADPSQLLASLVLTLTSHRWTRNGKKKTKGQKPCSSDWTI